MAYVKYIMKKLIQIVVITFLVSLLVFFSLRLNPTSPLTVIIGNKQSTPELQQQYTEQFDLDEPLLKQYIIWLKGIAHGDLGIDYVQKQPILNQIIDRIPITIGLVLFSTILGTVIAILIGVLAAMKRGTFIDYLIVGLSVLLISVPHLIFGLLLQKVFAGNLRWFPTIGWPEGKDLWFGGWKYTVLPTLTGCFSYIATYTRLLKTSMLDVVNQDYVLTAESKGLSKSAIICKHILRNSFIPVMTQLPMSVAMCITGSFFIESIFSIPGIGQYYVTAVNNQDLSIVLGETVLLSILYIAVIFITDILYVFVDPRIQMPGKRSK